MTSLVTRERELYEEVFQAIPTYRDFSPGQEYAPMFAQMVRERGWLQDTPSPMIIDAGCGTGKGALALAEEGLPVSLMCDLTYFGVEDAARPIPFREAVLWKPLIPQLGYLGLGGRADFLYCCDVMEHLPKEYTMLAIAQMLAVTRKALFLSISLKHDRMGAWLGTSLHKTVESFVWWRDNLKEVGEVLEARDLLHTGIYLVRP